MSEYEDINSPTLESAHENTLSPTIMSSVCKSSVQDESLTSEKSDVHKDNISDDLISLEREIAELHHVQMISPVVAQRVEGNGNTSIIDEDTDSKKVLLEIQPTANNSTTINILKVCDDVDIEHSKRATSIENEDLIALLKGTDQANDGELGSACEIAEGVTIEGEGQFQIMEVFDDELDDIEIRNQNAETKLTIRNNTANTVSPKSDSTILKLSPEEERAVAMEQMATLNSRADKRKRKQDIVPLQLEGQDLVTSLGAEWSDDEATAQHVTNKKISVSLPISVDQTTTSASTKGRPSVVKVQNSVSSKSVSNTLDTNKNKVNELKDELKEDKSTEATAAPTLISGFKRARVIKRKIIWDPDAPETQFSYANLVRSNKGKTIAKASSPSSTKLQCTKKELLPTTKSGNEKKRQRSITPSNVIQILKTTVAEEQPRAVSPVKKRSQTPVINGATGMKKKKISEIDRLMGDEGAINMLNALERQKMGDEENDDKPHKPLMRSRAAIISEKINKRETPPTASKKETISPPSKSKKPSKPKASASWDYIYEQKTNDESMIIRRRSNSSYSSSASQQRLSLDGPLSQKMNVQTSPSSISNNKTSNLSKKKSSVEAIALSEDLKNLKPTTSEKIFEFAKPESKVNQKNNRRTKSPLQLLNPHTNEKKGKIELKQETKPPSSTDVFLKKVAKTAQIIFNTQKAKREFTFTIQMMNKLSEILKKLDEDPECNAVVLLTNSPNFCQGVDFTDLISCSEEKRLIVASQLAKATKNYLITLATFSKPLIAGINGHVIGLGVTQLPLFDYVVASDKGIYETFYAKIGQMPEGFCIWNLSDKVRANVRIKLFWLCEKLNSAEGVLSGFISKLTAPNRVNEEAAAAAKKIASMSPQMIRETKKVLLDKKLNAMMISLDKEFNTIIEQWSSTECCEKLKSLSEVNSL